jgi:quinol monooxygenase YgiN
MGMFDTLQLNVNLLPVSPEQMELLSDQEFQTKSLAKELLKYRINEEGCLEYLLHSSDFLQDYEPSGEYENWILVNEVHGYISFYKSIKQTNEWFEFVAKFTDGKLVEIFRNQDRRYEENRRS